MTNPTGRREGGLGKKGQHPTAAVVINARLTVSQFIRGEARATRGELGFGWRPAPSAPSGLPELVQEFRACHASGLPLRVLQDFSDETIYDSRSTNWAFRFVHDTRHVWRGADFSTEAELAVASCHLTRARAEGLSRDSLAYNLLLADTVGQTLFTGRTHRFVVHQLDFALDCVRFDIDTAIQRELDRHLAEGTAS